MRKLGRAIAIAIVVVLAALALLLGAGLSQAVSAPVRREATIALPSYPAGTAPLRVALLSDIHFGNRAMGRERLERIVAEVNAARPDLVVITGDFVNGKGGMLKTDPVDLVGPLARLKAPQGVIATLGNHDHWTDPVKVQAALEQAGITVLSNAAARRGPLTMIGLDDGYTHHDDVAAALARAGGVGGAMIAVTHSPDLAPRLPGAVGVVLAGHTHCGQIVLPALGSLAPLLGYHVYNPRYECGVVHDGTRTVIITAGLGSGSIPLRIGAPPDWWLVTLRAA